jgi:hypothetical protein
VEIESDTSLYILRNRLRVAKSRAKSKERKEEITKQLIVIDEKIKQHAI